MAGYEVSLTAAEAAALSKEVRDQVEKERRKRVQVFIDDVVWSIRAAIEENDERELVTTRNYDVTDADMREVAAALTEAGYDATYGANEEFGGTYLVVRW